MQVVLLTEGSDLDSLSSAYALTLLEKDTYIYLPHSYSNSIKIALSFFKNKLNPKIIKNIDVKKLEKIFIVDTSSYEKIKQILNEANINKSIEITAIDHHKSFENFPKDIKKITVNYGACTTYFIKQIEEKNINIDKKDATILALGLYEDTGSFRYSNTTYEDIKALSFLVKKGIDFNILNEILSKRIDEKSLKVINELLENLDISYIENTKIAISKAFCNEYIPDISQYLNLVKEFSDQDALFILIISKNKITIIGRSNGKIDVASILAVFGGGGHKNAAAATIKNADYEEIIDIIETLVLKQILKDRKVEDIAIKNFQVVKENTFLNNIKNLDEPFLFVVDKEGIFKGILFTKTVKNALKHKDVKSLTAKEFSIDDIIVFDSNTPIYEVETKVFSSNQDIFPVLKDKKPIGYISKKSYIASLHISPFEEEKDVFKSRQRLFPKYYNLKHKVKKYFPENIIDIFLQLGNTAKKLNMKIYLVGGIVRDIILGRKNLDIDILVEGDAIKLAYEFAKENGFVFHKFEEFMTAQVKTKDNIKLDFATARREIYEYPGAYPKVEKATLREDLFRRDFTINTLAIDITEENFGILLDYFYGYQDIRNKKIRVLHELSFIEDPIRIFRALRFAGRFGFKLGSHTEKLLKVAIQQNFIKVAPEGRINLELNLTFNEENVIEILFLMDEYKLLNHLIKYFVLNDFRKKVLEKIRDNILYFELIFNKKADKSIIYLLGLLYHLPLEIATEFLEKYYFEKAFKSFEEFYYLKDKINENLKNSEIYEYIKGITLETKIFLISYLPENLSKRILDILNKEKEKFITGKDLISLGLKPSPKFSKIQTEIFKKYLDNEIKDKKQALEYIKQKFL